MNKTLFDGLRQSLEEAKAIAKGEMQPSRRFIVKAPPTLPLRAPQKAQEGP